LPWQAHRIAAIARAVGAARILLNNGRHVWWVKRFTNLPVIVVYHGGKLPRVLRADAIITINEPQRDQLIAAGFPAERIAVIDNVYPDATLPAFEARSRRQPLRIGTLRLLEPAKGVDVLIAAAAALVARGHDIRVEIGSEGTQRAALEAQVQAAGLGERVTFHGWIADRAAFYRGLDIYVLPSRFEEWGIGILEAWAMSLPVVATACLGPRRIVGEGVNGLLVPVGEPVAMADAVERLIADPALAASLAAEGRREAERYTMGRIAPVYADAVTRWGARR
jgi:glycosyltransferase involved in cell wall biosynthesis